jgi:hypothetical protein
MPDAMDGLPPPPPRPDLVSPGGPPPARDRAPLIVLTAVLTLVVVVVAGLLVLGDGEVPPIDLSRSPPDGSRSVYRVEVRDEIDPSEGLPEGVTFELSTTLTLTHDAGLTTIGVGDVGAAYDGQAIEVAVAEPQTIRLTEGHLPDAVVLLAADATGSFYYFVDMLFPVVPAGTAFEGDTWPLSFDVRLPAATGFASYRGTGEIAGSDEVGGVDAVEVRNELTFGYDHAWNAVQASELSGLGSAPGGTVDVTGTGSMTVTGWIDPATGSVLRSEVEGSYDVSFRYRDFRDERVPNGTFPSSGTFEVTLERIPGG